MKIIDWLKKGNVVRFYLGRDDDEEYYGDDWDDRPYEHNAGEVYEEYIVKTVDIAFPINWNVVEPADDYHYDHNSPFSKEDFKNRTAPFLIAIPVEICDWYDLGEYTKYTGADTKGIYKFYFGDSDSVLSDGGRAWTKIGEELYDNRS